MDNGELEGAVPVSLAPRRDGRPVDLGGAATACSAPSRSLQFLPDGSMRACSESLWPLGHVGTDDIVEVWRSARRAELVQRLAAGDMSRGCEACGAEFRNVGRADSFAAQFDRLAPLGDPDWPARLEFILSEECNLACVHCYGAVRAERWTMPDASRFDVRFVDQLGPFLAHAAEAVFGGGEPFVIEPNYRIWERIATVAPDLACTIVTNATHWNPRIQALMERLHVGFVVSIDGATAATYEAIRVNASWSQVRANLDRLRAHTSAHGTWFGINFVLMDQNHHELGLVAELADDLDAELTVVLARHPENCAIGMQDAPRRRDVVEELTDQLHRHAPHLLLNRAVFERAVAEGLDVCDTHLDQDELVQDRYRILLFQRSGNGPHDDGAARAELAAASADGEVHEVRVGRGDVITWVSPWVAALDEELVGRPAEHLQLVLNDLLGAPVDQRMLASDEDRLDVVSTYTNLEARTVLVAMRDAQGHADEVRILFCLTPRTD
jgi:MoaA/NifB/PqqE/SkfB family radical SAM enzyme